MSPVRNPLPVESSTDVTSSEVENSSQAPTSSEEPSQVSATPEEPSDGPHGDVAMEDVELAVDLPVDVPPAAAATPANTPAVADTVPPVTTNVPPAVPPVTADVPPAAESAAAAAAPAAAAAAAAAPAAAAISGAEAGTPAVLSKDPRVWDAAARAALKEPPMGIAPRPAVPPGYSQAAREEEFFRRLPPASQEAARQSARPPAHPLPASEQLSDTRDFGKFLAFFVRVGAELRGKLWLPEVEAWLFRQFRADAGLAVAEGLQHKHPQRKYENCIFADMPSAQGWIFGLFFRDEKPADVVEQFLCKVKVGKNPENSATARDCTHLAHLVREAYGYYPEKYRMDIHVVLARIKALLPGFAQSQLKNAEVLTEKPITSFEHMLRMLRQCDDSYKAHVQSGQSNRSKSDGSGQQSDGKSRGNKIAKRGKTGKRPQPFDNSDSKQGSFVKKHKQNDLFCKYCKKKGHVVEDCRKLAYKKKLEAAKTPQGSNSAKVNALLDGLTNLLVDKKE